MIDSQPADPSGKTLVEPKLTPPVHSDEIAKPLVSKFVRNDVCDSVTIAVG